MGASKTFSFISLLLIIASLNHASGEGISIDTSQVSTTRITNTDSSLQYSSCSCDLYSSICDDRCCCDTNCPADSISAWKKEGLCLNKEYFFSLSAIPHCSDKRPKTLSDLQGGLRIYYQILKILFCIVFDNSEDSDLYKGFQSDADIERAVAVTAASTPAAASSVYVESPSTGSTFTRVTIPVSGFGSALCSQQPIVLGANQELVDCFEKPATLQAFCASTNTVINPTTYRDLTIRKASGSTDTATMVRDAFNRNLASSTTGYANGASTLLDLTPTYDGTACTCSNFVSEVNYRFIVDSSNLIQTAMMDIVVTTSPETFSCSSPVIRHRRSVTFLNSQENYRRLKGPGYRFGDPVPLGLKTDTMFSLFVEPLSFSYMKTNGECSLVTENADLRYSSGIRFGYSNTFSCSLTFASATALSNFCLAPSNLQMYANIINNIRYIGIYPNSNPAFSLDWFTITPFAASTLGGKDNSGDTCIIQAPIVSIFYSAVGEQSNPGYKINSATITPAESESFIWTAATGSTQTFTFKVYVDFTQLDQTPEFFVAPNPAARVSVPDNVLTPFITSKTS